MSAKPNEAGAENGGITALFLAGHPQPAASEKV